jgi:hypothetical protein
MTAKASSSSLHQLTQKAFELAGLWAIQLPNQYPLLIVKNAAQASV